MNLIAIDPGKMTGYATWTHGAFSSYTYPYQDALDYVFKNVHAYGARAWDVVIMEDFVISQRTIKTGTANWRRGMELEFIGAVRQACHVTSTPFVLQTPAQAKTFSTDEKLKRAGWWTKGLDHPRDAARHLMLYMATHGMLELRSLVGGT